MLHHLPARYLISNLALYAYQCELIIQYHPNRDPDQKMVLVLRPELLFIVLIQKAYKFNIRIRND